MRGKVSLYEVTSGSVQSGLSPSLLGFLGNQQTGQIMAVLWEGYFEEGPAQSFQPLVAARLLIYTVIMALSVFCCRRAHCSYRNSATSLELTSMECCTHLWLMSRVLTESILTIFVVVASFLIVFTEGRFGWRVGECS